MIYIFIVWLFVPLNGAEKTHLGASTLSCEGSIVKLERDEDTFNELKEMGLDIHYVSRNYNNEVIGIEYYKNFDVLTDEELTELKKIWQQKVSNCLKEKLASQWMIVQVIAFSLFSIYLAWVSHPYAGIVVSVVAVITMIKLLEERRIRIAKRNLSDAKLVYTKILKYYEQ